MKLEDIPEKELLERVIILLGSVTNDDFIGDLIEGDMNKEVYIGFTSIEGTDVKFNVDIYDLEKDGEIDRKPDITLHYAITYLGGYNE